RGDWDYPLALSAGLVLLAAGRGTRRRALLDVGLPALLAAAALLLAWAVGPATGGLNLGGFLKLSLLFTFPALVCFSFVRRPVRFGLGVGAIFLVSYSPLLDPQPVLFVARDFFGLHTVVDDTGARRHLLLDGRVTHG